MAQKLGDLVAKPSLDSMNSGLSAARNSTWLDIFGNPRPDKPKDCSAIVNSKLKPLIVTASVGPFRVTGLIPAIEDLREIFAEIEKKNNQLYREVKTAGMTCCRLVRGSSSSWSNHSFGGAVDLYFGAVNDRMGDNKVQIGLLKLYPYFHKRDWFWGAGYRTREDAMHFELSDELIRRWHKEGRFNPDRYKGFKSDNEVECQL